MFCAKCNRPMIAYKVLKPGRRVAARCYCDGCGADVAAYGIPREAIERLSEVRPEGRRQVVERPTDYEEYLQSAEWEAISEKCKERDGWRCRLCNSITNLQAHHRTYERLGHEDLDDLTTLCGDCHSWHHARAKAADLQQFLMKAGIA